MPLLAYCVVLEEPPTNFPSSGVLGARIESVAESGVVVLCSEGEKTAISAGNFQQAALEFHRVIQACLAEKATVPFRFPTWLAAEEIRAHLRQQASWYGEFLRRHAEHVQMEVRLAAPESGTLRAETGAEHLRYRAAQLRAVSAQADEVRKLAADTVIEWRERENPAGIRLYALVSRKFVDAFREKLNRAPVRVSGPWPATEFFEPHPAKN